jgi:hypothetical protein
MWNPRCVNDPGRVTDGEYFCSSLDQGGVHTNSGVPNHGYALLVDGGTYNGHTIAPIGVVKAAHLYFRAQTTYQTSTSDFTDHADALEASCTDLIGVPLEGLSTTPTPAGPSGEAIAAGDCAQVAEMIAAVELRTDPASQCNFQPVLQPGEAPACAGDSTTVFEEDFEDGLGGWTLSNEGTFSGWPGIDWVQATSLPGGRAGSAAFGEDPDAGNCDGGAGDISGVMRMESPDIAIPADPGAPRLTFDHYIASEANFDGGNLKVSINGGPFTHVPAAAFTFNPYNVAALQPTNPLAGESGFSGTDGGVTGGSWGQSQVDLGALGVVSGDTIRLRYDFGMDGCAGIDGWYVDDVTVTVCDLVPPTVEVVAGGSVNADSGGTFNLSVGDADGDPADVTLSATSSNQSLVSAALVSFGGSGADRTVTLNAANKKSGTAVVTVIATDADGGSSSVVITVFVGTNKHDVLNGTAGADLILGRNGNDALAASGDVDLLGGGRGVDTLDAGAGDDTMSGGAGDDVLTGGAGADVFDGGAGSDTATDFNAAEGDTSVGIP